MVGSKQERGFTLIEIMIVVAIIGVLAAIAIPMFMAEARKAKTTEAVVNLQKLARNATTYFAENGTFPQGTAAVQPGPDGDACKQSDKLHATLGNWSTDPIWRELEYNIAGKTKFSYHFESTSAKSAKAWAIADLGCTSDFVTVVLYLEGRKGGGVESSIVDPLSKSGGSYVPKPEP
jgi:type II secretion system protein G